MNFKIIFISVPVMLFTCTEVFAQDTVTVFANNKKIISFVCNESELEKTIRLQKLSAKKIKQLFVQVKGVHTAKGIYQQSLEITDGGENESSTLQLTADLHPKYNILSLAKKYDLFKGSAIKLFLVLNPANPRMMVRSQRIFLVNLTTK